MERAGGASAATADAPAPAVVAATAVGAASRGRRGDIAGPSSVVVSLALRARSRAESRGCRPRPPLPGRGILAAMAPIPMVLDCDPGHDDMVAILLAAGSPAVDLRAITTVAGNGTLEQTTRNALLTCSHAGIRDVPVAAG